MTGMGRISCLDANLGDVRRLQMSLKQQPDGPVDQLVLFLWLHNKNTAQRRGPGPGHAGDKSSIYTRKRNPQKCGRACWSSKNHLGLHQRGPLLPHVFNHVIDVEIRSDHLKSERRRWQRPARGAGVKYQRG